MKYKLPEFPPVLLVLFSIVSIQCGAAIAKGLFPQLGASGTTSLRIGLAAVILYAVYRPNLRNLSNEQWKYVGLYGISLGVMNIVFYQAIERIPIGLGVTLEFVGPLVIAIVSSRKAIDYLWALLAAAGIALIAPWSPDSKLDLLGVLLALLAGGFWAAYILLGGKISKLMNGGEAVSVGMLFATLVTLPFGIFSGGLAHVTPKLFGLGAALALLSSAIPFSFEMKALRHIPAKTFSILMSLEPAVASLVALLFLQEYLSFKECLAVVFVIIASIGAALTARKVKG